MWIRHTFVVDVLWVDARQPVSSAQPGFTALDVPLLGPRVCGSRWLEGRALTGHFLPPGHEVPVLPALPALHRGRCLFAAQHQVQEVRAPFCQPQVQRSLTLGCGPGYLLLAPRGRLVPARWGALVGAELGLPYSPCPEGPHPPSTSIPDSTGAWAGFRAATGSVVPSRWRSSGDVCRCPVSAIPSVGARGRPYPCRWPGLACREQPLPRHQRGQVRGGLGHDTG